MTTALNRAALEAVRSPLDPRGSVARVRLTEAPFAPAARPAGQPHKRSLLRFITCGSVDDGKSTLIGRLLFDSDALLEDQVAALRKDSVKSGAVAAKEIDYSLLLDGLAAEREQGITIDVAYRYFSTPNRSFIVADTPGHEQYTRNMATGASTADLAIILIDARKGVLPQTRRHTLIVNMLGVRHIVIAVNKMDLVGHSEERFREIDEAYRLFALDMPFSSVTSIPLSAKLGENVREPSPAMPWYKGPALLEVLETIDVGHDESHVSTRFIVQYVNRSSPDFRGLSGWLGSGTLRVGDAVRVLPSGQQARVARIVTYDGDEPAAFAGQAPTIVLDREVDVSRGDVVAADDGSAHAVTQFGADVLWMSAAPFDPKRPLMLKLGSKTVPARIDSRELSVLDIGAGGRRPGTSLACNDIAGLRVRLGGAVAAEHYTDNKPLGGFILIDRETAETVAMGLVRDLVKQEPAAGVGPMSEGPSMTHHHHLDWIGRPLEAHWRSLLKAVSWRATGSLDTFVLGYLFTGNAKIAAGISLTEVFTKILLYFGHERVWQHFAFGRVKLPEKT